MNRPLTLLSRTRLPQAVCTSSTLPSAPVARYNFRHRPTPSKLAHEYSRGTIRYQPYKSSNSPIQLLPHLSPSPSPRYRTRSALRHRMDFILDGDSATSRLRRVSNPKSRLGTLLEKQPDIDQSCSQDTRTRHRTSHRPPSPSSSEASSCSSSSKTASTSPLLNIILVEEASAEIASAHEVAVHVQRRRVRFLLPATEREQSSPRARLASPPPLSCSRPVQSSTNKHIPLFTNPLSSLFRLRQHA